jgi:undecaprenyl pyrophosphate synthase
MSKYTHDRTDNSLGPIYVALTDYFHYLYQENILIKNNLRFIAVDHSNKLPNNLFNIIKKLEASCTTGQQTVRVLLGHDLETDEKYSYANSIDYNSFKDNLLIPKIDLVIRTTEMRPSGGPVYAMSQAQFITSKKLNPEIDRNELNKIWKEYNGLLEYRKITNPIHTK